MGSADICDICALSAARSASPLLFALLLKLRHRHIARVRLPLRALWLSFQPPDFLINQTLNILKGCHLYYANRLTINVTERLRRRGLLKAPINIGLLKHSGFSRRPLQYAVRYLLIH